MSWAAQKYGPGGKKPEPQTDKKGGIVWEKGEGATDADIEEAKKVWELALKRRMKDGSIPESVAKMIDVANSEHTTVIVVQRGVDGSSLPDNFNSNIPGVGSGSRVNFDPYASGEYQPGVPRTGETMLVHIPGVGSGSRVNFDPYASGEYQPGVPRTGETMLVHEIAHSWDFINGLGRADNLYERVDYLEERATNTENWHRVALGIPQRSIYGHGSKHEIPITPH